MSTFYSLLQSAEDARRELLTRAVNVLGQKFNRLTVVARVENNKHGGAMWLCRCECGETATSTSRALRSGRVKSCGCLRSERTIAVNTRHGHCPRNGTASSEWRIWQAMNSRCYNPNKECFIRYGGRGIQVCVRWHRSTISAFRNFLYDMGPRPSTGHSIDRINNDWGYMPSNCRWATSREQSLNRRRRSV